MYPSPPISPCSPAVSSPHEALPTTVRRTLRERALLRRNEDHLLVACSGGPDSVALAHVLAHLQGEFGFRLTVASVDHGLRPEAAEELELVRRLAEDLALPFKPLAVRLEGGSSIQAAAREARYQALFAAASESGAQLIAVGHHLDDQAETVLFRLLRGAALSSLSGIEPRREDGVIRPLFDARRGSILRHLRHHRLRYCEDPSNQRRDFLRARIRNELLPLLEQENPRLREHLFRLAGEVAELRETRERDADALLQDALAKEQDRGHGAVESPAGHADLSRGLSRGLSNEPLRAAPPEVRRAALHRWLLRALGKAPSLRQLSALERSVLARQGEVPLDGRWTVLVGREGLELRERLKPTFRRRR